MQARGALGVPRGCSVRAGQKLPVHCPDREPDTVLRWPSSFAGTFALQFNAPPMVLAPISAPTSSGNGPVPDEPVTVVVPAIRLLRSSSAPWLDESVAFDWKTFGAQASSPGSPKSTKPLACEIVTLPPTVELHTAIDPGLLAVSAPLIEEFVITTDEPAGM